MSWPRDLSIARHADLIRYALARELELGRAHHRQLRDGVDADGEVPGHRRRLPAERVTRGEAALLRRGRREARIADDVARGVDVRDGRAERLVHGQPAALVGDEPGRLEPQRAR